MIETDVDVRQHFSNPVWVRCHRLLTQAPTPLRGRRQRLVESVKHDIEVNPQNVIDDQRLRALDTLFRQIFG
ncbi:hypothetical protein [Calycomorphotria hydatis]|uniref:Uncharacterized protein n=1 Tax=Calycomorphotria hydatis TaxID=2528027 RepID=A0A517T902_9PLAN|nr:hypothetical protein [Calycomorphotria hydatis]QDT64846.1 hypothetical protein V22_20890 [Calycomorphotria hydatis]